MGLLSLGDSSLGSKCRLWFSDRVLGCCCETSQSGKGRASVDEAREDSGEGLIEEVALEQAPE